MGADKSDLQNEVGTRSLLSLPTGCWDKGSSFRLGYEEDSTGRRGRGRKE